MAQGEAQPQGAEGRHGALLSNSAAIRAIAAAVETTLGPKGLNVMLVDSSGEVTVTNDGSTILSQIDASHPAAKILIRAARSQDKTVGDGTTTTTILASSLIAEGVECILKGVPPAMLIEGIRRGVSETVKFIEESAVKIESADDEKLKQAVRIAARGEDAIADAVIEAAKILGEEALRSGCIDLRDSVQVIEVAETRAFNGLSISKERLNRQMPLTVADAKVLVIDDGLEPDNPDAESLATERGFAAYMQNMERFKSRMDALAASGVRLIAVQKGVHDAAEEKLTEAGCIVLRRLGTKDLHRIAEHTGAAVMRRSSLDGEAEFSRFFGYAESVECDEASGYTTITGGRGKSAATIVAGAGTREVADEVKRIAEDACGALQSALETGVVAGGGAIELAASRKVRALRSQSEGMSGYGLDCLETALKQPATQIALNAGYSPLEKVQEALGVQEKTQANSVALDCDSGSVCDMMQLGILDPAGVKTQALKTASEVAEAILRINTIVRRRSGESAADE